MWQFKKFSTQAQLDAWIARNKSRVEYQEVFINNAYAVEYRKLRRVL